jgi:hypothetical protein
MAVPSNGTVYRNPKGLSAERIVDFTHLSYPLTRTLSVVKGFERFIDARSPLFILPGTLSPTQAALLSVSFVIIWFALGFCLILPVWGH